MNYIKRLDWLPGRRLGSFTGVVPDDFPTYPDQPRPERAEDLWKLDYTYQNDSAAVTLFKSGGFELIRKKSPDEIPAVRRLVFDLDRQPKSLTGIPRTRWHVAPEKGDGWTMADKGFNHTGSTPGWVRYHHVEPEAGRPARARPRDNRGTFLTISATTFRTA